MITNFGNKFLAVSSLFALLVLGAGCSKDNADIINPTPAVVEGIRLTIGMSDAELVGAKSDLRATTEENKVNDVLIFLFDADGSIYDRPYHFRAVDNADRNLWENANTVIIPKKPVDIGEKRVYVVANYVDKGMLQAELTTVTQESQLSSILYESATNDKAIATDGGVLMQGSAIHTFTEAARKATVDLKRAVAKLSIELYFDWTGLDATREQNFYQFRDLAKTTSVMPRTDLILTAANRTERYNDNKTAADYLWPFNTATNRVGPLTVEVYLNEYNQGANATNVPPYLYLKFKGHIPASGEINDGIYPPPAGGDYIPAHDADLYYRLMLPREIKRNTHYKAKAHIAYAGSKDAQNPSNLVVTFEPLDWVEVVLPSDDNSNIY